jgi:hypothetical protein
VANHRSADPAAEIRAAAPEAVDIVVEVAPTARPAR